MKYYSAKDLAGVGGLPTKPQNVTAKAEREGWPWRKRQGRGGGKEYIPPKAVREALEAREMVRSVREMRKPVVADDGSTQVVEKAAKKPRKEEELTDEERYQRDCGLLLANAIDELYFLSEERRGHKACAYQLAGEIVDGTADPRLIEAFNAIKTRPRSKPPADPVRAAGRRLERVLEDWRRGVKIGDPGAFLVPGRRQKEPPKPWHLKAFMIHYCRPSRPRIREAWRNARAWYEAEGIEYPSVETWYAMARRLPLTVKFRGRMTGNAWKAIVGYVKRDVSMFFANDIWVGDGHSFKAKVRHPIHGQPFIPEVTAVIDWVSRRVVGWSVDLSESTLAVSAALRHAQQQTRARPLVYYSDNGSGQTGRVIDHEVHGQLARQGIAHETGIPGNAQGRGIIERIWQHTTNELARSYPTCLWSGADRDTTRKAMVELNKVNSDRSFVPEWWQFIEDLGAKFEEYNDRPHSALRGKTPNDVYRERLDPDSIIYQLSDEELGAMWMPATERRPNRGVIKLWNNEYYNADLPHMLAERESVQVRFDIHNPDQVWVYRTDGRYLCTAEWNGHARAAFPVSFIEHQRTLRKEGRLRRIYSQEEEILAEASPPLIDVTPVDDDVLQTILDKRPEPEVIEAKPQRQDFASWLREKRGG